MLRQTKTTLKELTAQYRGVLRHAFLTSVAVMGVVAAMPANAAINVTAGSHDIEGDVITAVAGSDTVMNAAVAAAAGSSTVMNAAVAAVKANATVQEATGSYTPTTWNGAENTYGIDTDTTATAVSAGAAPTTTSAAASFTLSTAGGGATNLSAYTGGAYVLNGTNDPTLEVNAISIKDTPAKVGAYEYQRVNPSTGVAAGEPLTGADIVASPVLATTGYDYATTGAYRVDGLSSVNVSSEPTYADYQFTDGVNNYNLNDYINPSTGDLNLPAALISSAGEDAGNALAAWAADKGRYDIMKDRYDNSNESYQEMVGTVNSDQSIINAAIESYRDAYGTWKAAQQTYNDWSDANDDKIAYDASISKVIDNKATDAATTAATAVLATKADASSVYTKGEVDTALGAKADASSVYTKGEVDTALGEKANTSALNAATTIAVDGNYYDVADSVLTAVAGVDAQAKLNATAIGDLSGLDGNYVDNTKDVAQNLQSLNNGVQANADAIGNVGALTGTNLAPISDDPADPKPSAADHLAALNAAIGNRGAMAGTYTTTGDIATNIKALDTQVKTNTDDIGAVHSMTNANGNLAVSTASVAGHLDSLDVAIGNVAGLTGNNLAAATSTTTPSVADHLTTLNASLDTEVANRAAADELTLKQAMGYTDKLEENVSAGVASAVALSSVAVSNVKRGEVSVGGGYGYYNDQSALALGAAMGLSDRWSVNAGAGLGLKGSDNFSVRAGTNYKFKLF